MIHEVDEAPVRLDRNARVRAFVAAALMRTDGDAAGGNSRASVSQPQLQPGWRRSVTFSSAASVSVPADRAAVPT